uniref:NAD(P)H-dependent oxidoreductase n=1 Tax=Candidatus Scatousia sp. TaxID=3085663 RepID=UPI00402638FA
IIDAMEDASDVMLGSPVYLDMPTPQTVAFLTRLNCMAENTDRKFFANKVIHLVSTAFCSGTKTCIHAMMGACEMLGFTIKGRSSREYIVKWSDKKLRGGLSKNDAIWLDK